MSHEKKVQCLTCNRMITLRGMYRHRRDSMYHVHQRNRRRVE